MTQSRRQPASTPKRGEKRRRELLETACELFLKHGYADVSMDAIVTEAGASKATIYRQFGSKNELLVAVVEHLCYDFLTDLRKLDVSSLGLVDGLDLILSELVNVITNPRHVDFYRLVVTGTSQVPEVGRTWYHHGPRVWHHLIMSVLQGEVDRGRVAAATNLSDLPQILFDALFSSLTIRTVMLGENKGREAFSSVIHELIEMVVHRISIGHTQNCPQPVDGKQLCS